MEREPFDRPRDDEFDTNEAPPRGPIEGEQGATSEGNRGVESAGRDVQDFSRQGETRGADVVVSGDDPAIEQHGTTVGDYTRSVEEQGVDVLDHGPSEPLP